MYKAVYLFGGINAPADEYANRLFAQARRGGQFRYYIELFRRKLGFGNYFFQSYTNRILLKIKRAG